SLPPRRAPDQPTVRIPALSRGSGSPSPAPSPSTPGPSSALAACRSALPECPQPPPAISLLVISAPQPRDTAAMASRTCPPALGRLPIEAAPPATHRSTRPARDH